MNGTAIDLLCFRVGGRVFAVDIMGIREILRAHTVTPVPNAPSTVAGVLNLRGDLLPVVDLRALLQAGADPEAGEDKLVVVRAGGATAGILVDQVLEVVSVQGTDLSPVPGDVDGTGGNAVVAAFRREFSEGDGDLTVVMLLQLGVVLEASGAGVRGVVP